MSDTEFIDSGGKPIKVGSRVRIYGYNPASDEHDTFHGVVVRTTDPDGDADEEGRPFGINPTLTVKFDDGDEDTFTASWTAQGWWDENAPYQCEDLDVLP